MHLFCFLPPILGHQQNTVSPGSEAFFMYPLAVNSAPQLYLTRIIIWSLWSPSAENKCEKSITTAERNSNSYQMCLEKSKKKHRQPPSTNQLYQECSDSQSQKWTKMGISDRQAVFELAIASYTPTQFILTHSGVF